MAGSQTYESLKTEGKDRMAGGKGFWLGKAVFCFVV